MPKSTQSRPEAAPKAASASSEALPSDGPILAAAILHIRCRPDDKAAWVHAAQGRRMRLSSWVTEQLNLAAKKGRKGG